MSSKKSSISNKEIKHAIKHEQSVVRDHLKTLSRNSNSHFFLTYGRIIKYGTFSFFRNIWLSAAATLVMTITLVILMITVFASVVLSSTAASMKEKIDITIYLKPTTSEETLAELSGIMEKDSNVREVNTTNSEEETKKALEEQGGNSDVSDILSSDDVKELLLSAMPATMRISVYEPNNLDSVKNIVENDPTFKENLDTKEPSYAANQNEINTITKWANVAKNGGLILSGIFLIISILVIFNTIRMAIFSRREEIYMMKLVGADNTFIRGPFLVEAEFCGIISGVLASLIAVFGFKIVAPNLQNFGVDITPITNITDSSLVILIFLATIALGVIIGSISARLAVHKYLR
ncbi:permease-like cell division protein FtsX [Candidatus Saccharibacteria bacterium]|nr:permease-like cell division protein FtsX [Candidatus Saccharibacteria bacterium]